MLSAGAGALLTSDDSGGTGVVSDGGLAEGELATEKLQNIYYSTFVSFKSKYNESMTTIPKIYSQDQFFSWFYMTIVNEYFKDIVSYTQNEGTLLSIKCTTSLATSFPWGASFRTCMGVI